MSDTMSQERRGQLDYRIAAIVAYVAERVVKEHPAASVSHVMKSIYLSKRYEQLTNYDTYLYTYTFDELYDLFFEELKASLA
jgi:hypothetical protein